MAPARHSIGCRWRGGRPFVLTWLACCVAAKRRVAMNPDFDMEELVGLEIDENGGVNLPDGRRVVPFDGKEPEKILAKTDFVCFNGVLFGMHLPGKGAANSTFHYLKQKPLPHYDPVQVFTDVVAPARHLFIFPPIDHYSTGYLIQHRWLHEDPKNGNRWLDERLFGVSGDDHPCGSAPAAEPAVAATGAK
mmetsp:Transcript_54964/g.154189  ORF Transcript_54964/g.154189 Transcript_54964/m.154189 type:complete len:191 (+) Transcript_54964:85-657(+)